MFCTRTQTQNGEEIAVSLKAAPVRTEECPRDNNLHQDIFIVGPPFSGATTFSKQMSKKLGLIIKSIDELLSIINGPRNFSMRLFLLP